MQETRPSQGKQVDSYLSLIGSLEEEGTLKTPSIISAFKAVQRALFLSPSLKRQAGVNSALPIGKGQTISQPYTVAFMLELLQPREGQTVLDIGSGSGWTSALIASIVGKKGKVYALEIIPELCEMGRINLEKLHLIQEGRVEVFCQSGQKGLPAAGPFDRILCGASLQKLPPAWLEQLKEGGRIVTPMKESIWLFEKKNGIIKSKEFPGFLFVPFV